MWADRVGRYVFKDLIHRELEAARIDRDDDQFRAFNIGDIRDIPFATHQENIQNSTLAYRQNPMAFRIIELTTSYVLGGGATLEAEDLAVQKFLDDWWNHPKNRMALRQFELLTELLISGELFISEHVNPTDGMTYVRPTPSILINEIEIDPEDREKETRFHEMATSTVVEGITKRGQASNTSTTGQWWDAEQMSHHAINKIVGAVRGQGILVPILPWITQYKGWLDNRALINALKGAFVWDVTIEKATKETIAARKLELSRPTPGSVLLHNENETWQAIEAKIDAGDAERDGHALRLMIASGAGIPLHFLSEGSETNVATAREQARPTLRQLGRQQLQLGEMFENLARRALRNSDRFGAGPWEIKAVFEDLSRRDTVESANATRVGATGLDIAEARRWISKQEARELFNRFAEYTGEASNERATQGGNGPTSTNGQSPNARNGRAGSQPAEDTRLSDPS